MSRNIEQQDLFDWKPKKNILLRIWSSSIFFWTLYILFYLPIAFIEWSIFYENFILESALKNGASEFISSQLFFLAVANIPFVLIFANKKPTFFWAVLNSKKFRAGVACILIILVILDIFRNSFVLTRGVFIGIGKHSLFFFGLLVTFSVLLIIYRRSWVKSIIFSKTLWVLLVSVALIALATSQKQIFAFFSNYGIYVAVTVLVPVSVIIIWKFPEWILQSLNTKSGENLSEFEREEKRIKLTDEIRKTTATIIAGLFVVFGAIFSYNNYILSSEVQVTTRFSTAVELLNSSDISVRLGGLYALERIAKDSPKDHSTIMEILAAYCQERVKEEKGNLERSNSNKGNGVAGNQSKSKEQNLSSSDVTGTSANKAENKKTLLLPSDVKIAVQIIFRRNALNDREAFLFNLADLNLSELDIDHANLNNLNLKNVTLSERGFLFDTDFSNSNLQNVNFRGAYLNRVNFSNSNLMGADFRYAELSSSDFSGARLYGTDLRGINLEETTGLSRYNLSDAIIDEKTTLPADLLKYRDEFLKDSQRRLKYRE